MFLCTTGHSAAKSILQYVERAKAHVSLALLGQVKGLYSAVPCLRQGLQPEKGVRPNMAVLTFLRNPSLLA